MRHNKIDIQTKKLIVENLDKNKAYVCNFGSRKETMSIYQNGIISGYNSSGTHQYFDINHNITILDQVHSIHVLQPVFVTEDDVEKIYVKELAEAGFNQDIINLISNSLDNDVYEIEVKIGSLVEATHMGVGVIISEVMEIEGRQAFKVKFTDPRSKPYDVYDLNGYHLYVYEDEDPKWDKYISLKQIKEEE